MIIKNDGLPAPLLAAVSAQREPREGYSISQLVNDTPQMHALKLKHGAEIEIPASSRIWAAMGTAMHMLLAEHAGALDGTLAESRLHINVNGVPVSGQFDTYADGIVSDWKFVGVATTYGGVKPEHSTQVRLYAYLLRVSGFACTGAEVTYIYRDWMESKSRTADYPPRTQTFGIGLWSDEKCAAWLAERVRLFQAAERGEFADCTPAETWQRPTQYAVTKKGNKKAARVLPDKESAWAWAVQNTPTNIKHTDQWFSVTERPGADVRCESFCDVSFACPQRARQVASEALALAMMEAE